MTNPAQLAMSKQGGGSHVTVPQFMTTSSAESEMLALGQSGMVSWCCLVEVGS